MALSIRDLFLLVKGAALENGNTTADFDDFVDEFIEGKGLSDRDALLILYGSVCLGFPEGDFASISSDIRERFKEITSPNQGLQEPTLDDLIQKYR